MKHSNSQTETQTSLAGTTFGYPWTGNYDGYAFLLLSLVRGEGQLHQSIFSAEYSGESLWGLILRHLLQSASQFSPAAHQAALTAISIAINTAKSGVTNKSTPSSPRDLGGDSPLRTAVESGLIQYILLLLDESHLERLTTW